MVCLQIATKFSEAMERQVLAMTQVINESHRAHAEAMSKQSEVLTAALTEAMRVQAETLRAQAEAHQQHLNEALARQAEVHSYQLALQARFSPDSVTGSSEEASEAVRAKRRLFPRKPPTNTQH